jgi:hypothetical protein
VECLRRLHSGIFDIPVEHQCYGANAEHGGAEDPEREHLDHPGGIVTTRGGEYGWRRSDDCGNDEVDLRPSHEMSIGVGLSRLKAPTHRGVPGLAVVAHARRLTAGSSCSASSGASSARERTPSFL